MTFQIQVAKRVGTLPMTRNYDAQARLTNEPWNPAGIR